MLFLKIIPFFFISLGSTEGQDAETCWPDASFAMPKPISGCPNYYNISGCGVTFNEGFLVFNTEDTDNRNSQSPDLHTSGFVTDFAIKLEFCVSETSTPSDIIWPPGCYCLFESVACPEMFTEGRAEWLPETDDPAAIYDGTLPRFNSFFSGSVRFYFCCRCDGDINTPIILPREQEFYLMTHYIAGNSCQLVEGMDVRPEYIQWHTDNSNGDNIYVNPIPTGARNTPYPYIVFCYYSPASNTTTTPVSPVQSTTPQSTTPAGENDSTSYNRLVQDVVIPAVVPVTVLLCVTVVIVVTIIVVGVVCCRKKKNFYENPNISSPDSAYTQVIAHVTQVPDLPPNDSVCYSEICEHEDKTIRVNLAASYIHPSQRAFSPAPPEYTGPSPLSISQRLEPDDVTTEEPSLGKTEQDPDKKDDDVTMPTSTAEVSGFPPLKSSDYEVLNDGDDEDVTLEFYPPPLTEFALYDFIGSMKRPCRIPSDDIIIGEMIGQGNFGEVHKAVWKKNGEAVNVAVKTQNDKAKEKEKVTFLQEAATMGQFKHPNIVKMFGIVPEKGKSDSCEMIVMEYLSNGTLHGYLPNVLDGLTQAQASGRLLQFSREIATGMEYLSQKKFVHRDLAARNILLNSKLVCKIADFGMARDIDDSYYYKSIGGMVPLKWTAPEALAYRKYSTASDVWSYGCVLYEIWSLGEKPLEGLNVIETYTKLMSGHRQFPPPGCPRSVYQIMIDCWNIKPAARPSFNAIHYTLKQPKECILQWSRADLTVHENAAMLGADLAIGQSLYTDLQGVYCSDK